MSPTYFKSASRFPPPRRRCRRQPLCPGDLPLVLLPVRLETRFFTLPRHHRAAGARLSRQDPSRQPRARSHGRRADVGSALLGAGLARRRRATARPRRDAWRQLADRFGAARAAWIARVLRPTNAPNGRTRPHRGNRRSRRRRCSRPSRVAATGRGLASRAAGAAAAGPLGRGRAFRRTGGADGHGQATSRGRSPSAPIRRRPSPTMRPGPRSTRRAARDRRRHEMDDRLRRGRIGGHGAAHPVPAGYADGRPRQPSRVRRRAVAERRRDRRRSSRTCSTRTTTPTASRSSGPARRPTTPTIAAPATAPTIQGTSAVSISRSPARRPSTPTTRCASAPRSGCRSIAILPTFGRVERGLERDEPPHAQHERRAVAGGLGLLPQQHDRRRKPGSRGSTSTWARGHFVDPRAQLRSAPRRCAAARSPTACCRSPRSTCGSRPREPAGAGHVAQGNAPRPARQRLAPGGGFGAAHRQPEGPARSRRRSQRRDAHRCDFERVSHPQRLRPAFPAASAAVRRIRHAGQRSGPDRAPAAAQSSMAAPALADVECRLASNRVLAAGAGRRGLAVDEARARLHLGAPRRTRHRAADPRQARSAGADCRQQPACRCCCATRCCARLPTPRRRLQADETGADLTALLRDAELVDLVTGAPPTNHWRRQLERTLTVTGGRTIREFLEAETSFTTPALAALGEFRASLADLKDLDSEALAQLMQGTLDLSAHRLDAWVTSVATKRLAAMHVDGPNGQYVGAYGWVENLKPIPPSLVRQVSTLPAGEPGPLQTPANDSGFIHAPSMTHAATAALLRNAHLGPSGVPAADGSVRHRVCRRVASGRPRACSTACARASRSARSSAIASSACSTRPSSTTAAPWTASSPRCAGWRRSSHGRRHAVRTGRYHRRQERRRRPGTAPPVEGRAQRGHRGS